MAFVVVYDACVLHQAPVRDLFIRLATAGTVRARWTNQILDECFSSILSKRPDLSEEKLALTRQRMVHSVRDCLITGYESLIPGLNLPDPNDRHVLAAAIRANAQAIVTFNLKDFPAETLAEYDIEPKHPDEFLIDTMDLAQGSVAQAIAEQAAACKSPPQTIHQLLDTLREQRLAQSVARLRGLWPPPV